MTVADLMTILSALPPTSLVVVPTRDHSYRRASCLDGTALETSGDLSEDYGMALEPGEKRIGVVVFS